MLIDEHFIYAVGQKLLRVLRSSGSSHHNRINLIANLLCQLSGFSDQLEDHRMHLAALLLCVYQDAIPGALILTAGFLFKIECLALALSHADAAHAAVFI